MPDDAAVFTTLFLECLRVWRVKSQTAEGQFLWNMRRRMARGAVAVHTYAMLYTLVKSPEPVLQVNGGEELVVYQPASM
jgi:hypothetical protein